MVAVFLVDGPARGQVVHVSETTLTYRAWKPRTLPLIPPSPSGDLLRTAPPIETIDYRIELMWLLLEDEPELRACPWRFGWSVCRPAAWELPRLVDPDFLWIIRQRADSAVPITTEQAKQAREACKPPPPPDRHDVDWCRESNGNDACINGLHYGLCGHPNCYGACEDFGDCPCKCHIPERVRTGRPIRVRVSKT